MKNKNKSDIAKSNRTIQSTTNEAPASPKTLGYARVSTPDQSTDLQVEELKRAGCDSVITDDGISGATTHRPGLKRALESLKSGDTLVVWKLDRLGRSLADLISILDRLKADGIEFKSINEAIDTRSSVGRMMWQIIGAFAEYERSVIRDRVAAGQKRAKEQGVKFGRPQKLSQLQLVEIMRMRSEGKTLNQICAIFSIGRSTLIDSINRGCRPSKDSL
jgi:DNA invertase Pin-like site-specific DNA recombinase